MATIPLFAAGALALLWTFFTFRLRGIRARASFFFEKDCKGARKDKISRKAKKVDKQRRLHDFSRFPSPKSN